MADYWTQGYVAFHCSAAEHALLAEAFAAAARLCDGGEAGKPSAASLAAFPPRPGGGPWSGLLALFSDPDFPHLGAELAGAPLAGDPARAEIVIAGGESFEPEAIAALVHRCCPATLAAGPIGFEWASTCSKTRPGAFGGGWCAIFADRIEFETTDEALARALEGGGV